MDETNKDPRKEDPLYELGDPLATNKPRKRRLAGIVATLLVLGASAVAGYGGFIEYRKLQQNDRDHQEHITRLETEVDSLRAVVNTYFPSIEREQPPDLGSLDDVVLGRIYRGDGENTQLTWSKNKTDARSIRAEPGEIRDGLWYVPLSVDRDRGRVVLRTSQENLDDLYFRLILPGNDIVYVLPNQEQRIVLEKIDKEKRGNGEVPFQYQLVRYHGQENGELDLTVLASGNNGIFVVDIQDNAPKPGGERISIPQYHREIPPAPALASVPLSTYYEDGPLLSTVVSPSNPLQPVSLVPHELYSPEREQPYRIPKGDVPTQGHTLQPLPQDHFIAYEPALKPREPMLSVASLETRISPPTQVIPAVYTPQQSILHTQPISQSSPNTGGITAAFGLGYLTLLLFLL
ncbi:hypothetical protein HYW21_07630 [Candidatus Woesearchaeota archaeon]|nr:hypothetical protein [Candidatus Woesearchaeota archaeon]